MASAPIYCTHKELKRVFPQLDEFDGKSPIYGWEQALTDIVTGNSIDVWFSHNTGLVDSLFWDGSKVDKIAYNTTETTQVKVAITPDLAAIDVDSTSSFGTDDIIKIGNEYMRVTAVTDGDTLAVATPATNRGLFNTNAQHHAVDTSVYKIVDASADLGDDTSSGLDALSFIYDTDLDLTILIGSNFTNNNPNDSLVESGEDFTTMVTQFRTDASRYLDSRLDPKLPKNMWKNEAGEFDYMIVRTTALYAAAFMVRTKDPTSEIAAALILEADNNVQLLNEGRAALSWQNTGDASQGVLRDITVGTTAVRPVDFRGRASGVDYDLIKVSISSSTAGAIGTAKYNVYVKDSTGLKANQVVTEEVITGDYQTLAYGLQVRFAGAQDSSVAGADNEWEVEVRGYNEEIDTADLKGIKMTRRRYY